VSPGPHLLYIALCDGGPPAMYWARGPRSRREYKAQVVVGPVMVEINLTSDCLNVVKSNRQGDLRIYGQVFREINARKAAFSSVEFVHEHRDSNTDAHRISRSSIHVEVGRHV
jgi:hypothetical protein